MLVYAVVRVGFGDEDIGGVFKPLVDAINAADALANKLRGVSVKVLPYKLGAVTPVDDLGLLGPPEAVYEVFFEDSAAERLGKRQEALRGRA